MKKVVVRGRNGIYCPKDEYAWGTVEGIVEKLNAYDFISVEVRGSTNVDSPFVDFVIYAEGESAPMSDEEAECIADAINDIGIKLGTICTMQSSKPGAWIEEV